MLLSNTLKRLEGEVLETLQALGDTQQSLEHTGLTVDPHQLLGLELNPRAAVVADLVLWIGYLQWHFRTRGDAQPRHPRHQQLPQYRRGRRSLDVEEEDAAAR